jgi:hypothetical protein
MEAFKTDCVKEDALMWWIISNIPIILLFSIFSLVWVFLFFFRKYYRNKNLRLPFTQNLLRSPGQSLFKKIDFLNQEIHIYTVYLFINPILIYASYISHLYFYKKAPSWLGLVLLGTFTFGLIVYSIYKLTGLLSQRRMMRLGYDGEVAVGQELNQLLRDGYYVYHDFFADKFNIDHIVVGKKGVFAIETKAKSKPNTHDRQKDATVEYNGRALLFPKWTDTETIVQAERQASWLSKWLGSAVGEPLAVKAVVALPGWFVNRTSSDGILVVNPKQFTSLFKNIRQRDLSEEKIKRIVHQLEQKCRDVEPTSTITEQR